jgi:predicted PolB exonuclease-like 3'-5' exonuclease
MITNPAVFDCETSTISDIAEYANETAKPPARYKDPEKIRQWIEDAQAKQAQYAALDVDLARVVALCWSLDGLKLKGGLAKNEAEEKALIAKFWETMRGKTLVGYNILDFDLPLLIRRSQYLNVSYPEVSVDRYRHNGVVDLMQILSFNGKLNYRRLEFYCKRFGVKAPEDKYSGADVPQLVALGEWEHVKRHCATDVVKEWRLAERMGLIEAPKKADPDQPF